MFVAFAVANGRERVDRRVSVEFFEGLAEEEIIDEGVGGQRQVMSVLLDGRGRQDEQGAVFGQGFDLLPVKVGEVAGVGNPGVHEFS